MKRFFILVMVLALFSVTALAGKNSQSVNISHATTIGTVKVASGDYDVTWTGSGTDVQVSFSQKKKVIVTVPAKLIQENNNEERIETGGQGGADVLQVIRWKNMTLRFEGSPSSEK